MPDDLADLARRTAEHAERSSPSRNRPSTEWAPALVLYVPALLALMLGVWLLAGVLGAVVGR